MNYGRSRQSGGVSRLIIGVVLAVIAFITFLSSSQFNEVTGENQHLSLTADQEIALGLQSKPEMIQEFGGLLQDQQVQQAVDAIGQQLVQGSLARNSPWPFDFNVLEDPQTINAFALPGGPIFITDALLSQLQTEDEVAGVLSHEMVHVLARHSAQQIAKSDLTNGLIGAVGVASGSASTAQTAAMIGQLVNMRYGRADETQSDTLGVCIMISAGYDPQGMVQVMQVLENASSGSQQPEFASTHPSPENRIQNIQQVIANADEVCQRFRDAGRQ